MESPREEPDYLAGAVSASAERSRESQRKADQLSTERVAFERFEQQQADGLAQDVARTIAILKAHAPPTPQVVAEKRLVVWKQRRVPGWSDGRKWFVLGADGTVYSGGHGAAQGRGFELYEYTTARWAQAEVSAKREWAHSVQDSYFDDSPYVACFENGDLSLKVRVYEEVRINRRRASDVLAGLLVLHGVSGITGTA